MAVIDCAPGLVVTFQVAGEDAIEYDNRHSARQEFAKTVTRYIESKDDAEFSITVAVTQDYQWRPTPHAVLFSLFHDGVFATDIIIEETDWLKVQVLSGVEERKKGQDENEAGTLRKFRFCPVKIVETPLTALKALEENPLGDLGVVEVVVGRYRIDHTREVVPEPYCAGPSLEVSEKAVKGRSISHGTTLSEAVEVCPAPLVSITAIESDNGRPIATFRFVCLSRSSLQKEMIIERGPSPDPLEAMSIEELRALARKGMNTSVKYEVKLKRERTDIGDVVDLTEENPAPRSLKKTRWQSPIDLTED